MNSPESYLGSLGTDYVPPPKTGFTSIEVLPFLVGRPWDTIALAYVHALRPSTIRVSNGMLKANARPWRVTVLTEGNVITEITQEVEVGLPDGVANGWDLDMKVSR